MPVKINYQSTVRKIPEEIIAHSHCRESLKSRTDRSFLQGTFLLTYCIPTQSQPYFANSPATVLSGVTYTSFSNSKCQVSCSSPSLSSYARTCPGPRLFIQFRNILIFLRQKIISPSPKTQSGGPFTVGRPRLLLQYTGIPRHSDLRLSYSPPFRTF